VTAPAERPLLLISGAACTQPLWPGLAERYDLVFLYPQAAQQAQGMGLRAAALAGLVDPDLQEHIANQAVVLAARVATHMDSVATHVATAYPERAPDALNGHLADWFPGFAHHLLGGAVAVLAQLERLRHGQLVQRARHPDAARPARALPPAAGGDRHSPADAGALDCGQWPGRGALLR
jgi:hypothetical protein